MVIGTVRHVDDDMYKRGMDRVRRSFGTMNRKKTIAALEAMLEAKEEVIEWQRRHIHKQEDGLTESGEENSREQQNSGMQYDTAETFAEGLPLCAGVVQLKPGDTVVLESERVYTKEVVDSIREAFVRAGINVIYLNPHMDITGVISGNA